MPCSLLFGRLFLGVFLSCAALAHSGAETESFQQADIEALRGAVHALSEEYPEAYPNGQAYLERLDQYESALASGTFDEDAFAAFRRAALLENPLLDAFDRILVVKRNARDRALGLPQNWQGNCSLPLTQYDNEIAFLSWAHPDEALTTLFKPERSYFVGDIDLHFDGTRLLFSMPGSHERSQIWELHLDGTGLRQVTAGAEDDVDNYDACYLPDGRIIYASTANYQGVPCVTGSDSVANFCLMTPDGSEVRQLCFDQDHNWCPAVLPNGRILYTRWEYADLPHSNSRLLFHMNPDGTGQMEYYGSNSFWPTSIMYARPMPGHPTKIAAIATGHHGVPRMGELVILDPALGRREAAGAVQRIPGFGRKIEAVIADNLADNSWPKFLHPYPLSEDFLLAACQPGPDSAWGIYLVDIFDNVLLLCEEPGYALFEPIPVMARPTPPIIPDKARPGEGEGTIYLANVYAGPGLQGIPRGAVRSLRVFSYTWGYRKMGGMLGVIGMDGPWDMRRILGTVPVEADGSAFFRVPANTPIAVQPLDAQGRALQIMRSWFTAMPGETLSCAGCHEPQNVAPPTHAPVAARRKPHALTPWRGPARPFSFAREVQPVLDVYCLGCHDGTAPDRPDLRGTANITDWKSDFPGSGAVGTGGKFSTAYAALHKFVRRPGIESDIHLLTPMEFHASTTELVQILERGHHGVVLDEEAWDRLTTWIDLNTPFHGTWSAIQGEETMRQPAARRRQLLRQYAGIDVDYESIPPTDIHMKPPALVPAPETIAAPATAGPDMPAPPPRSLDQRAIELGYGVTLTLLRVPAGAFTMGGGPEGPAALVTFETPFWLAQTEVTNAQFACFDAQHDSGVEIMHGYQFGIHGYPLNGAQQPVVRVSWERAMDFCGWLSERTGQSFSLPTEAEWEYACRAGSVTPFSFGGLDTDFSPFANLGDARLREFARNTYIQVNLLPTPNPYDDWIPKEPRFDDNAMVSSTAGAYAANPWGLHDMHGNVWEWTRSTAAPYPYVAGDGRNNLGGLIARTVRGGSWYDRPQRAASGYRLAYAPFQRVFNVGFRVACHAE